MAHKQKLFACLLHRQVKIGTRVNDTRNNNLFTKEILKQASIGSTQSRLRKSYLPGHFEKMLNKTLFSCNISEGNQTTHISRWSVKNKIGVTNRSTLFTFLTRNFVGPCGTLIFHLSLWCVCVWGGGGGGVS